MSATWWIGDYLFKVNLFCNNFQGKVSRSELPGRPLELFMCSVLKRQGYGEGFRWLAQYIDWSAPPATRAHPACKRALSVHDHNLLFTTIHQPVIMTLTRSLLGVDAIWYSSTGHLSIQSSAIVKSAFVQ